MLGWAMVRSLISEFRMGLGIILGMPLLLKIVIGTALVAVAFVLGSLINSAVLHRRKFLGGTIAEGLLARLLGSLPPVVERLERLEEIGLGF